jgi:HD-GYP domain-containing protein (c-di-GMP phosphodiesterase class II)
MAAALLCTMVLIVISINLYNGDGMHDSGILAYPLFIMFGAMFFGKRTAIFFFLAAVISLAVLAGLEIAGYVHPTIGPTRFDILIPMIVLLMIATSMIWITVANLEKDLDQVKAAEAELSLNYDLTIQSWAKVLEYRDRETEGHSRRLVQLSTRLGKALGLGEQELVVLRRGALLHDIGKLAIPDSVFLKPGSLDDAEMEIIHKHPIYARQMLEEIPFLNPSIAVAYSHHERWDGNGYPEGLKGDKIPLLARIFTVVDTWDALNSDRPYRMAWPMKKVKDYIKQNAGIIFDPHIVDVFLNMVQTDQGPL